MFTHDHGQYDFLKALQKQGRTIFIDWQIPHSSTTANVLKGWKMCFSYYPDLWDFNSFLSLPPEASWFPPADRQTPDCRSLCIQALCWACSSSPLSPKRLSTVTLLGFWIQDKCYCTFFWGTVQLLPQKRDRETTAAAVGRSESRELFHEPHLAN